MKGKPKDVDLDSMLTLKECAAWLRLSPRTVRDLVGAGKVPVFAPNQRVWRFHPRTILVRFNHDTGTGGNHAAPI